MIIIHGLTRKETIINTAAFMAKETFEFVKDYGLAIGGGIAAGLVIGTKTAFKKEKGLPENYESDAVKTLKTCDYIVEAL